MSIETIIILTLLIVNVVLVCWCMILDTQVHQRKEYCRRIEKENLDLQGKVQSMKARARMGQ